MFESKYIQVSSTRITVNLTTRKTDTHGQILKIRAID